MYGAIDNLRTRLLKDGCTEQLSDEDLADLLDTATILIDGYCKRDFELHADDELIVEGKGLESLLLPKYPLISITAISIDGKPLTAAELAGLSVKSYGRISGTLFPAGSEVIVTCTWGYAEPPAKIAKWAVILGSRIKRHGPIREKAAEGMRSQSVEGVSLTLDAIEIDRDAALALEPFRVKRAAA